MYDLDLQILIQYVQLYKLSGIFGKQKNLVLYLFLVRNKDMSWPEEMSFIANSSKIDRHKGKCLNHSEEENPRGCTALKQLILSVLNIGKDFLHPWGFACSFCFVNLDASKV